MRIGVFVSGSGTNLQALIEASAENFFDSEIVLVVSNNKNAYGLTRAKQNNIPTYIVENEVALLDVLKEYEIDLIVLAGYLKILGQDILEAYKNRIINIHPALLPKYGGMGMYGMNVHKAVFNSGDKKSGATVHYVTEEVDNGEEILQFRCNIEDLNSPEEIQERVLILEHQALKTAIKIIEEE